MAVFLRGDGPAGSSVSEAPRAGLPGDARAVKPGPSHPPPPGGPLAEPREGIRRRLLRANTALAILIAGTLILAVSALWQSLRATRHQATAVASQRRAETAEAKARSELWRALLAEARATRRGASINRRGEALESLRRAAGIAPAPEVRDEAIVALALPQERVEGVVPLEAGVRGYDFAPDLRQAAVGLTNGDVAIYQLADGRESARLRLVDGPLPANQGAALGLTFSRGGRALAVRHQHGALSVWDLESGRMRFALDADQVRRPSSRAFFSSDDTVLVAPVFSPDGFGAFDARTRERLRHFPEYSSYHHCAVRPGATEFAVYSDGIIDVRDWRTGGRVAQYACPGGARVMEWSADGRYLAIGSGLPRIELWDVSLRTNTVLSGLKDLVMSLQFDPSGRRLAAVTQDRTTFLWNLPDPWPVGVFEGRRLVRWGPAGATGWAVSRERLEVRHPVENPTYARLPGGPSQAEGDTMDVSPDGRWAVSKAYPEGLLVWNLTQPAPPAFVELTHVQSLCFHPVESRLLILRDHQLEARDVLERGTNGRVSLDVGPPVPLPGLSNRLTTLVTVAADGRTRAYVESKSGRVWVDHLDRDPGLVEMRDILHSSVEQRSGSARGSGTLALSPDGRWLAVAVDGGWGMSIFDGQTGRRVRTLAEDFGGVQFSPDGRWLAFVAQRVARVFRTGDWSEVWSRPGDVQAPNASGVAAFSPDGTMVALATSSRRIGLVATESGAELGQLEAPDAAPIRIARWSRDGTRLVLATRENTLDVWQPRGLQQELTRLGLDWGAPPPAAAPAPSPLDPPASTRWVVFPLFGATGGIAFVALAFWWRHRRLLVEYSYAESRALRRDKELQVERELHELKTQFVSTVSHEFRTPLGVIMASAENLKDYHDRLSPGQRGGHLHDIIDATRTMSGLMEEVLLLGRVESGKVTFRPAPLDLRPFCERVIEDVLAASDRRCPIELHLAPAERPARGDEGLLRHILTNLLNNAVKFSPAGRPIELGITPDEAFAMVTIRDHGIGIPAEDLPHLFEAFHRGSNVGDTPGSGLGMVIVKRCVEMHGGTIECQSVVGEGTTVTVRLPLFRRL